MAFGQSSGPPASNKELTQLAELLEQAGYASFREARHPFGLTQRQAGGKFTRDEAAELIARLEADAERVEDEQADSQSAADLQAAPEQPAAARPPRTPSAAETARRDKDQKLLVAALPDKLMADELELRGWTCIPPLSP